MLTGLIITIAVIVFRGANRFIQSKMDTTTTTAIPVMQAYRSTPSIPASIHSLLAITNSLAGATADAEVV